MEKNVNNIDRTISIERETFISALNEVNAFIATSKVVNGSNMIAVEAIKDGNKLVITGLGLDSSLISKTTVCEKVGSDMLMYIDGPSTSSKLEKATAENLTLELVPEMRRLVVKTGKGVLSLNAASEIDFAEDGTIVENKNTTYAIGEVPIRVLRGRKVEDAGTLGVIEVSLSKFNSGLSAAAVSPYVQVEGGAIKVETDVASNTLKIVSTDGYQINLCEISDGKMSNMENGDIKIMLKSAMVENLKNTMSKVLGNLPKKKKDMPSADDPKVKIAIGKAMLEIEMKDISITTRKYSLEVENMEDLFDVDFIWHGIVNLNEIKNEIAFIMRGAKEEKKDGKKDGKKDTGSLGAFKIDTQTKTIQMGLTSSLGEAAVSEVEYKLLSPDFPDSIENSQMNMPYAKLFTGLKLMTEDEVLIRVHKVAENIYLISIINADNHDVHGLAHGLVIAL